jgi:hypothetical protein
MHRALLERRIRDVHARLVRAREDLAVLDEQLAVVMESADEARVRSLVAETPLAAHEHSEAARHADAMAKAREILAGTVSDLEHRQDELLADVAPGRS